MVAIVTREHLEKSDSKRPDGKKLSDFADLILDTGAPAGDAMVSIPNLESPVSPGRGAEQRRVCPAACRTVRRVRE